MNGEDQDNNETINNNNKTKENEQQTWLRTDRKVTGF